jgi:hypothetical protein
MAPLKPGSNGPVPDDVINDAVQQALQSHGCLGTCSKVQVFELDGATVRSTCVQVGQVFNSAELTASPHPPCL